MEQNDVCESPLVEIAMKIILHAGDARIKTEQALEEARNFKYEKAKILLCEARECLRLAHITQTEVIQNETRGVTYDPCLLFNHAQDTIMTIMSEEKLAEQLIAMFEAFYQKFAEMGDDSE